MRFDPLKSYDIAHSRVSDSTAEAHQLAIAIVVGFEKNRRDFDLKLVVVVERWIMNLNTTKVVTIIIHAYLWPQDHERVAQKHQTHRNITAIDHFVTASTTGGTATH